MKIDAYDEDYSLDESTIDDIYEEFSFMVPGSQYSAKFHERKADGSRVWDGMKRMYTKKRRMMYRGLEQEFLEWAEDNGHSVAYDPPKETVHSYTMNDVDEWYKTSEFTLEARDYQKQAFLKAMNNDRQLFLMPTSSGKSFCIQSVVDFHTRESGRALIVVPTTNLVKQFESDIISYCKYDVSKDIQTIMAGLSKKFEKRIVISTWHSLVDIPPEEFNKFTVAIFDEVHKATGASITSIIEDCTKNIPYRYGYTATIKDAKIDRMMLEGMFSKAYAPITMRQLIDRGYAPKINITCITLLHDRKKFIASLEKDVKPSYEDEFSYIIGLENRNQFLTDMVGNMMEGNTIMLYQRVDAHGQLLYEMLKEKYPDRPVFFVDGSVKAKAREEIRKKTEELDNVIIVASYGTFSTGMSIKRLHNCVFTSSMKDKIITLQSLGRILRLHETKDIANLWDISDDLMGPKIRKPNHLLKHRNERMQSYVTDQHDYEFFEVSLTSTRTARV